MVLMVRSFRSTMNLLQWFTFSTLILLSMFAVYCVESKSSYDLQIYPNIFNNNNKRRLILDNPHHHHQKDHSAAAAVENGPQLLPTNLVLVSTLDGSIRGIDRFEGRVHWTLKGGPGSSLIKSNSHFETHKLYKTDNNNNDISSHSRSDSVSSSLLPNEEDDEEESLKIFLDTVGDVSDNNTEQEEDVEYIKFKQPWSDNDDEEEEEEEMEEELYYIIEPQDGGILYIYGDGRPLEKLPFSIKEIVNNAPFRTLDGTTYIGRKNTMMIEIDPRNGKILQQIDLNKADNQARMATRQHNQQYQSPRTILLGRNEYKVSIFDNNNKWWNVTYSEYIPNKFDYAVPTSMVSSDIYIAPDASRALTGISVPSGTLIWNLDLPFPVVNVFDVYRREDYSIALSIQNPPTSLEKGEVGDLLSLMAPRQQQGGIITAYVGVHEGSLYALSTKNYPLVQIAPWSSMYTGRKPGDISNPAIEAGSSKNTNNSSNSSFAWTQKPHEACCHGCELHVDCIIGQHVVQSMDYMFDSSATSGSNTRSKLLLPSDSPTDYNSILRSSVIPSPSPTSTSSLPHQHDNTYYRTKEKYGFFTFWKSYILVTSVIVYVYRDRVQTFYQVKVLPKWKKMMKKRAKEKKARARIAAATKTEKENTSRDRADSIDSITSVDADQKVDPMIEKEITSAKEEKTTQETKTASGSEGKELVAVKNLSSKGLDLESFKQGQPRVLEISNTVLGYGSHGTVVYKGSFDGRKVAVKRLLLDFYDVALKEVKLLQESDDHPNVVRYFYKEETDRFLYIALELCFGSLNDYMERSLPLAEMQLCDTMNPADILAQFISGLQYLHSLKIVHRDIKPHNLLLAPSKHQFIKDSTTTMRVLISDFGLCKKLDGEQSSFNYTAASPAGTTGWRAPELLQGALAAMSSDTSMSSGGIKDLSSSADPNVMTVGRVKATRAIDIFSAGCVFYYVLSGGDHPFGNRFGRENNILKGEYDLFKLDSMGEDGVEAKDLVERMLSASPKERPTPDVILAHPFFWTTAKRLAFLQDASDRFETEERDPPSLLLQQLEADSSKVIGVDWYKRIDRVVANDLGKFRKYDGKRVRDLLRALRNKKHHWQDLPEPVKKVYGEPPNQFLYYFTARFPHLLLHTYYVVSNQPNLRKEGSLGQYF